MIKCTDCGCDGIVKEVQNKHKHGIYCSNCGKQLDWGSDLRDKAPDGIYKGTIIKAEEEENKKLILVYVDIKDYRPLKYKIFRNEKGKYKKEDFLKLSNKIETLEMFFESLIGKEIKVRKSNKNIYLV